MYPSNSNGSCDCDDPIPYSDHSFFNHGYFATDTKQDEDPNSLSFFNFPSPYYNQFELDDVFLPYNQTLMPDSVSDTLVNMTSSSTKKSQDASSTEVILMQSPPRKRSSSSKRDRHSKIITANGPRDRRMRLSLDVAQEFFGLQDMLGFDKASRTVEWLLIQSRQEIKKLVRARVSNTNSSLVATAAAAAKSPSSNSEGEVVSALGQPTMIEKKILRQAPNPLARDLREKARERAKARTKAKKLCCETMINPSLLQATVDEFKDLSSRDTEHTRVHHGDMIYKPLPIIEKWSPNPMFNCLQNSGIINQEHQLTGFVSFGKPWEAYN